MTTLIREQGLLNILAAEEVASHRQIDWYLHRRKTANLGGILCELAGYARTKGMYAYFIEGNVEQFKQYYHLSSKLVLASVGQIGGASFEVGRDIQTALLSDSKEVIDTIAHLETPELVSDRNNPLYSRFHVNMLQLAIRGEDDSLRIMIEKIANHGKKPMRTECKEGRDFFSLLIKNDKAGLEDLIQNKHAKIRSEDARDENFMSYFGTLEAKLCWYRGIPVEIDHPLVPMELMPIRPLEHYDDVYDFLKPGWQPPPQGFFGKLSRFFGRKS